MKQDVRYPLFLERLISFDEKQIDLSTVQVAPEQTIRFSVLIRTCKRPGSLRQALESLAAQQYKNFEVLVAEDGPQQSRFVCEEFPSLCLRYFCTEKSVGRCETGNLLMREATGDLLNFLDDDDALLPNHLAVLADLAQRYPTAGVFCAGALEGRCVVAPGDGAEWSIRSLRRVTNRKVTFSQMAAGNLLPIQSTAFRRQLVHRHGGFNPQLDAYEDWDLWQRFLQDVDAVCSERITSFYKIQADLVEEADRTLRMKAYRPVLVQCFAHYEKNGVNAGKIAAEQPQSLQEDQIDELRRNARPMMQSALAVAASRRYRAAAPWRALQRALGNYPFLDDPQKFASLNELHAFLKRRGVL